MSIVPDRTPLKDMTPFRFWCQKILPLEYDDSMSYYELLCKVVNHLNNAIDNIDALNDDVTTLYEFVDHYFENLDVTTEINNKLDQMASDGTLSEIISPLIPNYVTEWLNNHITPTSPVVDRSLMVRDAAAESEQTGFLARSALSDRYGENYEFNLINPATLKSGVLSLDTGAYVANTEWDYTETYFKAGTITASVRAFVIQYDENYNFIRGIQLPAANQPWTPPADAKYLRFCVVESNAVISYGNSVKLDPYMVDLEYVGVNRLHGDAIAEFCDNTGFKYLNGNIVKSTDYIVNGEYYDLNTGEIKKNAEFKRSAVFYPVTGSQAVSSGRPFMLFYDRYYNFIAGTQPESANTPIGIPGNAKFFRFCVSGDIPTIIFGSRVNANPTEFTMNTLKPRDEDKTNTLFNQLEVVETGNIVNLDRLEDGYYNLSDGNLLYGGVWKHDPTFYALDGSTLYLRNAYFIAYYNEDFEYISSVAGSATSTLTPPSGAKYFRYSMSYDPSGVYGIYLGNALGAERKIVNIKNLSREPDYTIVAIDGSGDYTSLTQALYESTNDIYVKAGTYYVVNEYKALFGNDIFSQISDTYELRGFQSGLVIDNREVKFSPSARVICDLTNVLTVDDTHRFSMFNLKENAILTGAHAHGAGVFYLIHDDFGLPTSYYTNIVQDSILTMSNPVNRNVIGGGVKMHSTHIIRNNYMNNGLDANSETMRYHNYDNAEAGSKVEVYNNKVNGFIGARYYGQYTTGVLNFVAFNNVTGSGVKELAETAGSVDNVSLFAWNNSIAN